MGKKGDLPAYQRANAFLLEPKLTPKVFKELAKRYEDRQGGYTRIHKFGNRPGDNAPHAILELVDNPRDIKFEMTARAVGWELLGRKVNTASPKEAVKRGVEDVQGIVQREQTLAPKEKGVLREKTRWSLQKVLRFRSKDAVTELRQKADDHIVRSALHCILFLQLTLLQDTLLAQPLAMKEMAEEAEKDSETPLAGRKALRLKAGQALPGTGLSAMHLAQGALGKERAGRSWFGRRKLGIDTASVWSSI